MSVHDERTLIDWVVDTLTAGGLTVGDSIAPSTVPDGAGYVVVYSVAGGTTEGPVDDPHADATPTVQLTSSSHDPKQTRWLAMKAREVLLAEVPITVGNRRVLWLDFATASITVTREDNVQPPRFSSPDRIEFGTTPA